eukprot:2878550-Pleurochrysis_carterae.AAC.1
MSRAAGLSAGALSNEQALRLGLIFVAVLTLLVCCVRCARWSACRWGPFRARRAFMPLEAHRARPPPSASDAALSVAANANKLVHLALGDGRVEVVELPL